MTTQPVDPGFRDDVRAAFAVWRGSPLVPALYLLFAVVALTAALTQPTVTHACGPDGRSTCPVSFGDHPAYLLATILNGPLGLFYIGLCGAARVWYARRFAGQPVTGRDVWTVSWRMFWRMVRLGLLLLAFTLPLSVPALVLTFDDHELAGGLLLAAALVAGDVAFTFATPGVALYNPKATTSFRAGLRLLRSAWPECAAYALVPPLALVILAQAGGDALPRWLHATGALLGPPLTLLFAGAATRFVLRRQQPLTEWGTVSPPVRGVRWEPPPPGRPD